MSLEKGEGEIDLKCRRWEKNTIFKKDATEIGPLRVWRIEICINGGRN